MITKTNLKDVLKSLGFTEDGDVSQKSIGEADLKVDFASQQVIYPEDKGLIVNERQTCNFRSNENFVVFECVHRLLEKGYKPKHLELEPKWRVGRGPSGGRADILVKDQENNPLLIIECKTPGREFDRAWRDTQENGGQLFTYAQQIAQTQYLCLYASNLTENDIRITQKLISLRDNEKILEQDNTLPSFKKANTVEERFAAWRDTYQLEATQVGIFEENIQAYQIGKDHYTYDHDTKPIDAEQQKGQYHEFRTILRQHNIARRENAFEVLVNLFLCKLVDEEENKSNLKFYWKGIAYDDYYDFFDRLQNLFQKGMDKYLKQKISYISNDQIDSVSGQSETSQMLQRNRFKPIFENSSFSPIQLFRCLIPTMKNYFSRTSKFCYRLYKCGKVYVSKPRGKISSWATCLNYFSTTVSSNPKVSFSRLYRSVSSLLVLCHSLRKLQVVQNLLKPLILPVDQGIS